MITSRFTIGSADYDYRADQVEVRFVEDRDDFRRVDGVVVTDVRRKLPVIRWRSVMVAANANAGGLSAAELFEEIEQEVAAGTTVEFVPDPTASAPNSTTPSVEIVTRSRRPPASYRLEESTERLTRAFEVQGARWLDPSDAADKDIIDDLNSLTPTL
jgi:hypothetical protein